MVVPTMGLCLIAQPPNIHKYIILMGIHEFIHEFFAIHFPVYLIKTQDKLDKIKKIFVFSAFNQSLEVSVIQFMLGTYNVYIA